MKWRILTIWGLCLWTLGITLELSLSPRAFAGGEETPQLTCADESHRTNQNQWYEILGAAELTEIQRKKGMLECPDYQVDEVQLLLGLKDAPPPTEIAVYGAATAVREASYLIRNTRVSTIHLVEVSGHYDEGAIEKMFGNDSPIAKEVREQTHREVIPQVRVDYETNVAFWKSAKGHPVSVIFWMFAGIMELSPNEKKLAITQAWKNLAPKGVMVIDIPEGRVTSPSLDISHEGDDMINFKRKIKPAEKAETPGNRLPTPGVSDSQQMAALSAQTEIGLRWHPIVRATGEVNKEKLIEYFTHQNRFRLYKERTYYAIPPKGELRRLLFFMKNG